MEPVITENKRALLNLGCGYRYHKEWTNVDFIQTGENVISYNLTQGVPFDDHTFDVVYHSHVLEHFSKDAAPLFIQECFRVLKPGGIIRIAVPDLEQIVREYLNNLEGALTGDVKAELNYDWIMIELYDQTVRETTGGAYGSYWWRENIPNEDYMIQRMGYEYKNARKLYYESKKHTTPASTVHSQPTVTGSLATTPSIKRFAKPSTYLTKLKKILFKKELQTIQELKQQVRKYQIEDDEFSRLGRFRRSGEIHQWMYDRFSLKRLLEQTGFVNVQSFSAYESSVPDWNRYELDTENGEVRKPDSLFMEGIKP